jgi:hypothetical protein
VEKGNTVQCVAVCCESNSHSLVVQPSGQTLYSWHIFTQMIQREHIYRWAGHCRLGGMSYYASMMLANLQC